MLTFLSIIIPCYNVEQYLPATLQSLSRLQHAEDCEFILVNDGSTDNTPLLIQHFADQDPRAVCISQTNQGVSAARNAAIAVAKGQYLLCLDGDDTLIPDAVTLIRQNLQGADVLLSPNFSVQPSRTILQDFSIPQGRYTISDIFHSCDVFPLAPMLVYRTGIIRSHALHFNPIIKSGEVYDFTVSFFEHANTIQVIHTGFYNCIARATSASHAPNYQADATVLYLLDHFNTIQHDWADSPAFLTTAFRMVCAFTYNKYLRLNMTDSQTLDTLTVIFNAPSFQDLLYRLSQCPTLSLRDKLMSRYIATVPLKGGYIFLTRLYHLAYLLRNIFH